MTNQKFQIQVGNAFQPQDRNVQRCAEGVTNHLDHHDSRHYKQQGLNVICDLCLSRKENKGLPTIFFFTYLEMKRSTSFTRDWEAIQSGESGRAFPLLSQGQVVNQHFHQRALPDAETAPPPVPIQLKHCAHTKTHISFPYFRWLVIILKYQRRVSRDGIARLLKIAWHRDKY